MKEQIKYLIPLLLMGELLASAQNQFGTVFLNNYDSNKGLFELDGRSAALPGTIVEVLGGPGEAFLAPIAPTGKSSTYVIQAGDVNANGVGSGSFFDYGFGVVNGVPPGATAVMQIRFWRGADTFDQASIRGLITWTQTVGTNPRPPNLPVPAILEIPTKIVLAQALPPSLVAPLQNQTVAAGTSVTFNASATGASPLRYEWRKNGVTLAGITSATLVLPSVSRATAGTYTVTVTDSNGGRLTNDVTLRVRVPQRFEMPTLLTDGRVQLLFRDQDGSVASLDYATTYFAVQVSTNLMDWQSESGSLSLTNDFLVFEDATPLVWPARFYRLIER